MALALALGPLLLSLVVVSAVSAQPSAQFVVASDVALNNPHDLKLSADGKYLFVADVGNSRVAILDPASLSLLGEFGSDHQSGTHDVDFDAHGRAYVADTHNNRVTIYAMDGVRAQLIGELAQRFRGPEGILSHPNGRTYVAGAWSHNVVVFENGKVIAELTGLSSPHDLALAPNGDIWLADAGNDRMLLLSPDLVIKRELKGAPYQFDGVRYQAVLPDGTLIVADKNNHQIKIIAADGTLQLVLGSGRAARGAGQFTTPEGVEARGTTLWLSDSGNNRIVKYTLKFN
jgi:DNA-binding beta-propeller fold protein YncE